MMPVAHPFRRAMMWLLPTVILLASPLAVHAQTASAANRVLLPENLQPPPVQAVLTRAILTSAEASAPLRVDLPLKLRNFAELQSRVAAGETISRAEMASRFLPAEDDYQTVARWLADQGLSVAAPGASRAMVAASGTPGQLRQAFQTSFARVAFQGEEYTAAVAAPSLPVEVESRVASIHGLQPYLRPHKLAAIRKAAAVSSTVAPPYLVGDILNAYNAADTGLTGAGQQIGIIIDTVPMESDLTKFWTVNGVSQSLGNIITVNVSGQPLPAPRGEETIDVSWSSGVASGAQIIVYACGELSNVRAAYSRILDDLQSGARPNLHQISMSYGAGEQTDETPASLKSTSQLFTAIAAYGVSLFAASGDNGAFGGTESRSVQVLYPASDPNVTGVGGTTLRLNPVGGAVSSELGWSHASASRGSGGSIGNNSSGGGVSSFFPRPSWQVGASVPGNAMRLVPDVALAANPDTGGYLVFNGQVAQCGGTSWSAPNWAALCAMMNQGRAAAGRPALGAANPALYPLLGAAGFRDITSGNNGAFAAGPGYDLVTGLGSPVFDALLSSAGGTTVARTLSGPAITSPLAANGGVGSAFAYQITANNSPTAFAASGLPAGLSVDASTGLISGAPTTAGVFAVTLSAANGGGTSAATLTLTVTTDPLPPVSLAADAPQIALRGRQASKLILGIPRALPDDLIVYYTIKGSAANGVDYVRLSGHAKIKAGRTRKAVRVISRGKLGGAARKVVKIGLAPGAGYAVGAPSFAKVVILNE